MNRFSKCADEFGKTLGKRDNISKLSTCLSSARPTPKEKCREHEVIVQRPDGPIIDQSQEAPSNFRVKRSRCRVVDSEISPTGLTASGAQDLFVAKLWLEALTSAVVITGGTGRIQYANGEARSLLDEGDAIMADPSGFLRCRDSSTQHHLTALTRSAVARNRQRTEYWAIGFPRDFRLPLSAMMIMSYPACTAFQQVERLDESRVLFFFRDPERVPPNMCQRLEALFGLTKAESQVVGLLAIGMSIKEIAADRAVSLATVRNQLKSAQSKIGVSRQAELVSVVLRSICM